MENRRDFLKKAALLSGGVAFANLIPPVIQKALAINPEAGSTFYDAEHIVFLMQENRSFDHQLGMLQGVRGFNDPRAINLVLKLLQSYNWYDFSIKIQGYPDFEERFAGRVETGQITKTDPLMGGLV